MYLVRLICRGELFTEIAYKPDTMIRFWYPPHYCDRNLFIRKSPFASVGPEESPESSVSRAQEGGCGRSSYDVASNARREIGKKISYCPYIYNVSYIGICNGAPRGGLGIPPVKNAISNINQPPDPFRIPHTVNSFLWCITHFVSGRIGS